MVLIQRIRVRWSAGIRGAVHADARRRVPQGYELALLADEPFVVHDVLADETARYQPTARRLADIDQPKMVGLRIQSAGDAQWRATTVRAEAGQTLFLHAHPVSSSDDRGASIRRNRRRAVKVRRIADHASGGALRPPRGVSEGRRCGVVDIW